MLVALAGGVGAAKFLRGLLRVHHPGDLLVVGNKGMTGAKRFLLGSVPNKVSHHAPCSVMIIRTT